MKSIYIITMWSGGGPAKKWKSTDEPQLLPQGTGVEFTDNETKLRVRLVGSVSIEEFESGNEELQEAISQMDLSELRKPKPTYEGTNIERLF
jgi:hypothetical protein